MDRRYGLIVLLTFANLALIAQGTDKLPADFNQINYTYFLVNPASIGVVDKLNFSTGIQSYNGVRRNLRNIYAHIEYTQGNDSSVKRNHKHAFGLNAISEKEGEYISSSDALLNYAYHLMLSSKYKVAAGGALGFSSFVIQGTPITPGGADTKSNASLGIWFYSSTMNIGLSINSLFNNKLQPLNAEISLKRSFNFIIDKTFMINEKINLLLLSRTRYASPGIFIINTGAYLYYANLLFTGVIYKHNYGVTLNAGLKEITLKNENKVRLLFSYNIFALRHNFINNRGYEIGLGYIIK